MLVVLGWLGLSLQAGLFSSRGLARGPRPSTSTFWGLPNRYFSYEINHEKCSVPGRDQEGLDFCVVSRPASAMTPAFCDGCGKGGCKLLRWGRCRNAWFCSRECQIIAARQGHSGANCRPTDGARTLTAAEVAPRVPDAAGTSTTALGVDSASLAPTASSCHACGKNDAKLLRCGRCQGVWFCNRECQVAATRQGHSGANCRPANGAQRPPSLANVRSPFAAPSRPSKATDVASLCQRFS